MFFFDLVQNRPPRPLSMNQKRNNGRKSNKEKNKSQHMELHVPAFPSGLKDKRHKIVAAMRRDSFHCNNNCARTSWGSMWIIITSVLVLMPWSPHKERWMKIINHHHQWEAYYDYMIVQLKMMGWQYLFSDEYFIAKVFISRMTTTNKTSVRAPSI